MRVAVSGSTGLIGSALVEALGQRGDEVVRLRGRDLVAGTIDRDGLEGLDGVVHLAGESIGAKLRWTRAHKRAIRDSRLRGTTNLANALANLDAKPAVLVSGSAVGFYGDRDDQVLNEDDDPGTGFLAEVVQAWEAAARPASHAGIRVVSSRTGLVLSSRGGLLPRMAAPVRFGVGARLGDGSQWMSWISIDDAVGALLHLLTAGLEGPVNVVGPAPATNAELTAAIGRVLKRPTFLAVPAPLLRLALDEAADETALVSQRVTPDRLVQSGYEFRHTELEPTLAEILGS